MEIDDPLYSTYCLHGNTVTFHFFRKVFGLPSNFAGYRSIFLGRHEDRMHPFSIGHHHPVVGDLDPVEKLVVLN